MTVEESVPLFVKLFIKKSNQLNELTLCFNDLSFSKIKDSERKHFLEKYHCPTNLNRPLQEKVLKSSVKQILLNFGLKSM